LRLSALVHQRGVDAFTFEDFLFVGRKVSIDPSRLILVGGQAIETWGVLFDILAPTGDRHPLTEDTDWLGSKRDAQWLCDLLGSREDIELQLATPDDAGPSSALAYLKRPDGRILLMDFLHTIVGPSSEEIRRLAVPIKLDSVTLHVMHPLLCLESRLANLQVLETKRRGNGPMQAQWAIDIGRAFLLRTVQDGRAKEAAKACRFIAEQAEFKYGRYCYLKFGLDPLAAVTVDVVRGIGGRFETEEWPRIAERLAEKRRRWAHSKPSHSWHEAL
jgi:hypothetical protein